MLDNILFGISTVFGTFLIVVYGIPFLDVSPLVGKKTYRCSCESTNFDKHFDIIMEGKPSCKSTYLRFQDGSMIELICKQEEM